MFDHPIEKDCLQICPVRQVAGPENAVIQNLAPLLCPPLQDSREHREARGGLCGHPDRENGPGLRPADGHGRTDSGRGQIFCE